MELMQASRQWASRPSDERFLSMHELRNHAAHMKATSIASIVSSHRLELHPIEGEARGLVLSGANGGGTIDLSHWSFGQLARYASAPAQYLRDLPGHIAAQCMNDGLMRNAEEQIQILTQASGRGILRACTSPTYGRVWNETIVDALIARYGDGVTGDFRVPGIFGKQVPITKQNTTIYGGDRDMFVFLADEKNRIEIPNRRHGKPGSLARGFFVWNSEVGAQSFGLATFLFDFVCENRIVWGAAEYQEIRHRHSKSAPSIWIEAVAPLIQKYAESSTKPITDQIEKARATKIPNINTFLKDREFSNALSSAVQAAHMAEEERPMETLWDICVGVTAHARSITFQDDRVMLEKEGGRILALAKAA